MTRIEANQQVRPTRPLIRHAVLTLLLAACCGAAWGQSGQNLGYLDGSTYQRTTLTRAQPTASFWFYLRHPGMTVTATVQDFGGRGIDQAILYDAGGKTLAESRNRVGAQIGARGLAEGWHRLFLRSRHDNHQVGITLRTTRPGAPADVGNNFDTAHDLGSIGANGKAYPNSVGPGDSADFYRFQLGNPHNHLEISLAQARRDGAYLELYRLDGSQANFVARATANGGNQPLLVEQVAPGTYFARVTPALPETGSQGTDYKIYVRNRAVAPDPGGDLNTPFQIRRLPAAGFGDSLTPQIDPRDAWQFQVPPGPGGGANVLTVQADADNPDYALYLIRGTGSDIIANDTTGGAQRKTIRQAVAPGTYKAFIITQGTRPVNYRMSIAGQAAPPSAPSGPAPISRISYGGFLYDDHSGNTSMQPKSIPLGGSFTITSTTMRLSGPTTGVRVVAEVQNRRPGSFGLTRLSLPFQVNGSTLIVQGPDQPAYANQTYRIVVVSFTDRRPDSYASPGILTVGQ